MLQWHTYSYSGCLCLQVFHESHMRLKLSLSHKLTHHRPLVVNVYSYGFLKTYLSITIRIPYKSYSHAHVALNALIVYVCVCVHGACNG